MGKNKLQKFAEYDGFSNTFDAQSPEFKGVWGQNVFGNSDNPLVLDLACGRGEYTVGLAQMNPHKNYIGVDIKGARMWKGAKFALENQLPNVAFLRTQIEQINHYFGPNEISEIWMTFPDPQPQLSRVKKRLTSPRFLDLYRTICSKDTIIHLKTDSDLLYSYTKEVIAEQSLQIKTDIADIYKQSPMPDYLSITTYYENMWLKQKRIIKFLEFSLYSDNTLNLPNQ